MVRKQNKPNGFRVAGGAELLFASILGQRETSPPRWFSESRVVETEAFAKAILPTGIAEHDRVVALRVQRRDRKDEIYFASTFRRIATPLVCLLRRDAKRRRGEITKCERHGRLASQVAFAHVNGTKLNYLDWGGDGPPVVMMHRIGDDPQVFDDLALLLSDLLPARRSVTAVAGREWLVAIAPIENGLLMEMLRYADELRTPKDFFDEVSTIKPDKEMVDLAVELIDKKSGPFHPEQFEDHYQTALKKLVQAKSKGRKIIAAPEEPREVRMRST